MADHVWETFNELFKIVHRQSQRIEELEARVGELERKLDARPTSQEMDKAALMSPPARKSVEKLKGMAI
jgi:phage shock protein A